MDFKSRIDDLGFSPSSSTDWRAKYLEAADMLAETRTELDDFQHSSKELEEELERELERTEKAQADLRLKISKVEVERDDWKSKFMSLQTTYNTTTTSLQRELDTLRQEQAKVRKQLVQLEMGNDDLERNERAVASSLADVESKYSRVLEEKIILEQELLGKASLEEECQRLRDDLRDSSVEVSILKDQLEGAKKINHSTPSISATDSSSSDNLLMSRRKSDDDMLLKTPPPPDLQLSDLTIGRIAITPPAMIRPTSASFAQSALLSRAGVVPPTASTSSTNTLTRSQSIPSLPSAPSPSRLPRTPKATQPIRTSTSPAVPTTSKSKGVQMVSEMRQRVRNLEQKIHSRVPRLRNMTVRGSDPKDKYEEMKPEPQPTGSPGWVFIMEEGPTPRKERERPTSSPVPAPAPSSFRPLSLDGTLSSSSTSTSHRRPSSRLSASTIGSATSSGTGTTNYSSIPTPTSRPSTPTFLPVPSSSGTSMLTDKRASMPAPGRRSSLGTSLGNSTARAQNGLPPRHPPPSKAPPPPPPSSMPPPSSIPAHKRPTSSLGQSRIARPASLGSSARKSISSANKDGKDVDQEGRTRSGSLASSTLLGVGSTMRGGHY